MRETKKTILDVFPLWKTDGVFAELQEYNIPWKTPDISDTLDDLFFTSFGERPITPYLEKHLTDGEMTGEDTAFIAKTLYRLYGVKWSKLFAVWSFQYDPIENYSMIEQMSNDTTATLYGKSQTRTDNLSHMKTGTETEQPNTTETETPNTSETRTDNLTQTKTGTDEITHDTTDTRTDDLTQTKTGSETTEYDTTETQTPALTQATNVYGFNSSTASPAGSQVSSGTNTTTKTGTDTLTHDTTETQTGTVTNEKDGTETTEYDTTETQSGTVTTALTGTVTRSTTGTDTHTYNTTDSNSGTQTVADSGTDTTTRNYRLTRSGNIGVTTSQQMIQSEIDLWQWEFFDRIVFPDILNLLALPIY